jgi:hypothetical protein
MEKVQYGLLDVKRNWVLQEINEFIWENCIILKTGVSACPVSVALVFVLSTT